MLPKSARLFLLAAILASVEAKAAPRSTVSTEDGELDLVALRELAIFTLAGAQLFASDSTLLPSSLAGVSNARRMPLWVDVMAAGSLVATVTYLVLSGG